jgi:serine/threonine protein kinase
MKGAVQRKEKGMKPKHLGPYRLVRILGHGGMGAVYEAVNRETDEPAAIKILSASLSKQEDFRQRFESEIATLRKLRHPNIVRLFGFGEQDGVLFYAMELVDGKSLQGELESGRLFTWREVAQIGIQTARALRHAHDRGVVHRDIKPANLLLCTDGSVKLSDFGIARLFGSAGMTAVGNVLGTVEFMAPEQADAQPPGPRADLYSLGAVFFALLTGRPPFRAGSPWQMLEKQRFATPEPVRRYAPDVPTELESMIAQLLEKNPQDRIANATILSRRLEAMLHALPHVPDSQRGGSGVKTDRGVDLVRPTARGDRIDSQREPGPEMRDDAGPSTTAEGPPPLAAELPETKLTSAFGSLERIESDSGPPAPAAGPSESPALEEEPKPGSHFTAIGEEDLDQAEYRRPSRAKRTSLQTLALAIGLIAIIGAVWYLLQPPSADALYNRITARVADQTEAGLLEVDEDIQHFLTRYSADPRCQLVREYQRKIELERLDRRFERLSAGQTGLESLLPIERVYVEAIADARLDPERAIRKLNVIIDLYPDPANDPGRVAQCLELARGRLDRLRARIEQSHANQLAALDGRLDAADQLSTGSADERKAAARIRRAVIEHYQDEPWASQAVRRAREALAAEDQ